MAAAITELAVGEALVSFLDGEGRPGIVERAWVLPPHSLLGTLTPEDRQRIISGSPIEGKYEHTSDRLSAYEMISQQAVESAQSSASQPDMPVPEPARKLSRSQAARRSPANSPIERMAKSAINTIGRQVARDLVRGLFGTLKKR